MPTTLSNSEAETLHALERTILRGMQAFMEVGAALMQIRDERLYRAVYGNFEDYCREAWGMGKRHANQTIQGYQTVLRLESEHHGAHSWNERQARELTSIPEKKRSKVLNKLIESGETITADAIRQVWHAMNGKAREKREAQRRKEWMEDFPTLPGIAPGESEAAHKSVSANSYEDLSIVTASKEFAYSEIDEGQRPDRKGPVYCEGFDEPQEEAQAGVLEGLTGATEQELMEFFCGKLEAIIIFLMSCRFVDDTTKILNSLHMREFAFIYVTRLDLLPDYVGNTIESISKWLGVSPQRFEWYVRHFCDISGMQNPHQKSAEARANMSAAHTKESFTAGV